MATEPTPVVTTPAVGDTHNEPVKVTFSAEQQDKIQQLIDAATARAHNASRTQYDAKIAELTAAVEAAKAAKPAAKPGNDATVEAQLAEFRTVAEASKAETERFKAEATARAAEVLAARSESQEIRKEVAITQAASTIPFFNLELVKQVTKGNIEFDGTLKQFVVKGPNGQIRYDSTLEHPLSLEAYFTEYAAQNKYLVRSTLASGTGSTESTRTDVAQNGRFAVTDIFGPKSSSLKASQLMKDNPQEYARLKGIARQERLIA
jgi:hypothetical protein